MNVFQLFGRIGLDDQDYRKGLDSVERETKATGRQVEQTWQRTWQNVQRHMTAAGQNMQKAGQRMTLFVTTPLLALAGAAIKAGSDAEETANKFAVVFRDVRDDADATARNLRDNFGLSSRAAQQLLADTGDLLTGFGFAGGEALELSTAVNELAVDLASFTNFSGGAEGASAALTKALLGERESIKSLGIAISEEDVQLEMLQMRQEGITIENERQAKAWATLRIAQRQSKNAIGDFARSQDAFANRLRIVRGQVEDLVAAFGKHLLPMVSRLLEAIGGLIERFNGLTDQQRGVIVKLAIALAATGPLLIGLGTLFTSIEKISTGLGLLRTAILKIPTALAVMRTAVLAMAGPVGWIVLATTIVGGLVAILVGQRKDDPASLAGAIAAVDVAANDADAIETFGDRFDTLADSLSGPVKRAFEGTRDEIWSIVRDAESAQEALARIELGTRLTQEMQRDRLLTSTTEGLISTEGPDSQRYVQLRRALQRGDFAAAADVLEGLIESFAAVGDSQSVERLQAFLGEVLKAEDEIQGLLSAAAERPTQPTDLVDDLNNTVDDAKDNLEDVGESLEEVPRTVEGIFAQLAEDGARSVATAQRLIATGYDETEAQLEDLERRSGLLSTAREELLTNHWDELTDAELEYLNQRITEIDAEIERTIRSITPVTLETPDVQAAVDGYMDFVTNPDRLQAMLDAEVGGPSAGMSTTTRGRISYFLQVARERADEAAALSWQDYLDTVLSPENIEAMVQAEVLGPSAGMDTVLSAANIHAKLGFVKLRLAEEAAAAYAAYLEMVYSEDRVQAMMQAEVLGPSEGMDLRMSRGSLGVALQGIRDRAAAEAAEALAAYLEAVYSEDRLEQMLAAEVEGPSAGMETTSWGNIRYHLEQARQLVLEKFEEYVAAMLAPERVDAMTEAEVGGPSAGMAGGLSPGAVRARLKAAKERQDEAAITASDHLETFGVALLSVATQKVPAFAAALDGLATGGPIGAILGVFTQLLMQSETFQQIIERVNQVLEPVVGAMSKLLDALWPIIEVALTLVEVALTPLVFILENVVAPVFSLVAKVIASIWNAFATVVNAALGWLGISIPLVDLERRRAAIEWEGVAPSEERDDSPPRGRPVEPGVEEQSFNATAQSVQLAVATPLVEASYAMLDAAMSIRNTFGGQSFDLGVLPPFTSAISRITPVLERLLAEGIRIQTSSGSYAHLRAT